MPIVQVAFDLPLDRLFDYLAPDATMADTGRRILAPFGPGQKVGVILAVSNESQWPEQQLRPVTAIWRDTPPFSPDDLKLLRFCSTYYHHPLGAVLLNALPPGLRRTKGWLPPRRRRKVDPVQPADAPVLTGEQDNAVRTVLSGSGTFHPVLLHGVTGSGKTEIYLRLIEQQVAQGRQILVLTPEISLTPQLEQRFRERLPGIALVSMHSGLGEKERAARWLEAQSGEAAVVLGTRSAIFCPMPRLGLIVVDEEHDSSYKQQEGLRYSARDLALVRAQQLHIPVILGSATPALETWWNAQAGRYRLLSLSARAIPGARLPAIRLIETPAAQAQDIAPVVLEAIGSRMARNEQSLVFVNRRGYAPVLFCPQCHWISGCNRCTAKMVVHLRLHELRCHHCGLKRPIPKHCPDCGNTHLDTLGSGTQKIEAKLRSHFPSARILRLDSDSLTRRDAWEETMQAIHAGEVDILVGTQLLVKGHDFPKITLVAALGADQALYSSDFRSSERLFAQLVQVAGRAGRAADRGEVLIQTAFPGHPLFQALLAHDYPGFAQRELDDRRLTGFPPFAYQALLRAASENPDALEKFMKDAGAAAPALSTGMEIYDPVPPPLAKIAGKARLQLLVQAGHRTRLQEFLTAWETRLHALAPRSVQWSLDVDPTEL
ncbi:MAG: primosomal protein N' [Betaproteobacteria bacterium]|nr:primosomal protein N' [Betaproteobacteria bacterium]MDE2624059.1 primosomal protein N' [Betaproteobacteria bacterium]